MLTGATAAGSIYELRTAGIAWDQAVYLQGYYVPGDGAEGNFYCELGDATSIDNGGTIIVDVRMLRCVARDAVPQLALVCVDDGVLVTDDQRR